MARGRMIAASLGSSPRAKKDRRRIRKALGDEATFFAIRGFEVVRLRGFWGRLKWLLTGR